MIDFENFELNIADGIASIVMDKPPLNIMDNSMMDEFNRLLEPLVDDERLAAIVIGAKGKAFSAGVDVGDHVADKIADMIGLFHGIFRKLAATDALTIAVVKGAALGGGCELACFCDIVLASEKATFGQPEVRVGVFPPVAACVLPLQVGLKNAIEMTTLGRTIKAVEAHRIGLANHVYPVYDFDALVESYLDDIRRLSRPVVRLAKKATSLDAKGRIMAHLERTERLYLDELMSLSDAHEGIEAFVQKRAPQWSHT